MPLEMFKSHREHRHVHHVPSEATGHPAGARIPNLNKAVASGAAVNLADGNRALQADCFRAFYPAADQERPPQPARDQGQGATE